MEIMCDSFTFEFIYTIRDLCDQQTAHITLTVTINCIRTLHLFQEMMMMKQQMKIILLLISIDIIVNQPDIGIAALIVGDEIRYDLSDECRIRM